MSKRRADCGERQPNAPEAPPDGDEGACSGRRGQTARHDRRSYESTSIGGCFGGHVPKASGGDPQPQVPFCGSIATD